MAQRIVVLGYEGQALEIPNAMDADACVSSGMLRASVAKWSGPLRDATVLVFSDDYLRTQGNDSVENRYRRAWRNLLRLPMRPKPIEFELDTPIPVG